MLGITLTEFRYRGTDFSDGEMWGVTLLPTKDDDQRLFLWKNEGTKTFLRLKDSKCSEYPPINFGPSFFIFSQVPRGMTKGFDTFEMRILKEKEWSKGVLNHVQKRPETE